MRAAAAISVLLAGLLLAGACTGNGHSGSKRVGGCSADTIPLEFDIVSSCEDISSHIRISILSVKRAPDRTYQEAVEDIASILISQGAEICGVPQLIVIREGPTWPRHRIDLRLGKVSEESLLRIKSALMRGTMAGMRPSEKRPDGYGTFFVQAAVGSTDRWTLWYSARNP